MSELALFNLLVTLRLVVSMLAFVIAFQAFRGYRRNGSPPMLYLAVAFVLFGVKTLVYVPFARLFRPSTVQYAAMGIDVLLLGSAFLLIYYSLRLDEGVSA